MAFGREKERSNKTVGLCSICLKYIAHGHYKLMKINRDPQIVCEWCQAKTE